MYCFSLIAQEVFFFLSLRLEAEEEITTGSRKVENAETALTVFPSHSSLVTPQSHWLLPEPLTQNCSSKSPGTYLLVIKSSEHLFSTSFDTVDCSLLLEILLLVCSTTNSCGRLSKSLNRKCVFSPIK